MRKIKKKQNKRQIVITHPTLEKKTKIKKELLASSHMENDNQQIQSHS